MTPLKNFNAYEKAIKAHYEKKKNELYGGQLLSPTPATLKKLTLLCYADANDQDKETLRQFFESKPNRELRKDIEEFNPGQLRTLCMFLIGKTNSTSHLGLEVLALILDFEPRPYKNYLKKDDNENNGIDENDDVTVIKGNIDKKKQERTIEENEEKTPIPLVVMARNNTKRKWPTIVSIIVIVSIIILGYNLFSTDCNLMVWKKDHYEEVDCNSIAMDSIGKQYINKDENLLENMRMIEVNAKTKFFNKDGSPCIWYIKTSDKKLEFFTIPGKHPETRKTLKPISQRMIDKYVLAKNDTLISSN